MIRKVSFLLATVALASMVGSAVAQEPVTFLDRQLSRLDLGVSGAGEFNKTVSGPILAPGLANTGSRLTEQPSNTVGALVNIRYIVKPLVGFEFNYGYARYTENFFPAPGDAAAFGVQTQVNEYTAGYIYTPDHHFFGFQPFVSAGLGTMEFKPTPRGGQSLPNKARAAYYYSAGLQQEYFSSHFGLRASFRQLFYLAPDFGQNYLTIKRHTLTTEPTAGFYLRF